MTHTSTPFSRRRQQRTPLLAWLLGLATAVVALLSLAAAVSSTALADAPGPTTFDGAASLFSSAIGSAAYNSTSAAQWGQLAAGDGADALQYAKNALAAAQTCNRAHFQAWVDLYAGAKALELQASNITHDRITQTAQDEQTAQKRQDDRTFFASTPAQMTAAGAAGNQLTAQIATDLANGANALNGATLGDGLVAQADQVIAQAQALFALCGQTSLIQPGGVHIVGDSPSRYR